MRNGMRTANSISVSIRASLQKRGELRRLWPLDAKQIVSIRASLQQRGELRDHFAAKFYSCVSIRASLQQRGELIESLPSVLIEVSIRASLQQRGEPVGPAAIISPVAFQSAPHFSSEANARRSGARAPTKEFQSAPHFSSEANGLESDKSDKAITFQSAPHFSSEANHSQPATYSHLARFQSAPHFSSEANAYQVLFCLLKERFQSAPHFSSEANPLTIRFKSRGIRVSIRASLQQRGERRSPEWARQIRKSFNPRLTSAARRTFRSSNPILIFRFQSAPHFSSEANRLACAS